MDEKQLAEIIQRVLLRVQSELSNTYVLPKAYVIFPENWRTQNQAQCIEMLRTLKDSYCTIGVLPDDEYEPECLFEAGMCSAVKRSEAVFPAGESLSVFPVASRNLVVKTALCIQDDYETQWIAKCMAHGHPMYFRKESPMFTGQEPSAYRKKIEAYYREAESFGVWFDRFPTKLASNQQAAAPVSAPKKKRIITVADLKELQSNDVLQVNPGDVVTQLAVEFAAERGIKLQY